MTVVSPSENPGSDSAFNSIHSEHSERFQARAALVKACSAPREGRASLVYPHATGAGGGALLVVDHEAMVS
jgi:hypothetical protein